MSCSNYESPLQQLFIYFFAIKGPQDFFFLFGLQESRELVNAEHQARQCGQTCYCLRKVGELITAEPQVVELGKISGT